jgi:transcriptional regulator with XRE-family HTH domain
MMSLAPPDPVVALFGQRCKRARERLGWSARELGRKSGVSASTICRAEAGQKDMNLSMAARMAAALGVPLAEMVTEAVCGTCDGWVPAGFACKECGREGGAA